MKTIIAPMVCVLVICHAAEARINYALLEKGALAEVKLRVVDQDGIAVAGAKIWGGLSAQFSKDAILVDGTTNTNGELIVQGKCNEFLRVDVTKDGYYHTEEKVNFRESKADPIIKDGRWQPFGETRTVVLKKIRNPEQACVFPDSLLYCRIPEFGNWIGFDFEYADWVAPRGRGEHCDVLLKFTAMEKRLNDYQYEMEVSFTNNPYAGAYLMKKDVSSQLSTVYVADSNAMYQTSFKFVKRQSPGIPRQWDFLNSSSYLVFRTRTRIDEHGNLIGAHYGKIIGQWLSELKFMILSDGCYNPVENDVNIEDGRTLRHILRNKRMQ